MTINLTTNVTQPNITRWFVLAFDVERGFVTLRFTGGGGVPWVDVQCILSNAVNQSTGARINPSPVHWDDKIVSVGPNPAGTGGVGAANSLLNAQGAYRGAPNHTAGLRAVEGQALTDGWVSSALTGT